MKNWKVLLSGLVGVLILAGCTQTTEQTKEPVQSVVQARDGVSADEFEKFMKEPGVVILDVRDANEFASGHIPGAINVDVNKADFVNQIDKLDKGKHYLVYCVAGARARRGCVIMEQQGFKKYDWLKTGISEWASLGKPVTK